MKKQDFDVVKMHTKIKTILTSSLFFFSLLLIQSCQWNKVWDYNKNPDNRNQTVAFGPLVFRSFSPNPYIAENFYSLLEYYLGERKIKVVPQSAVNHVLEELNIPTKERYTEKDITRIVPKVYFNLFIEGYIHQQSIDSGVHTHTYSTVHLFVYRYSDGEKVGEIIVNSKNKPLESSHNMRQVAEKAAKELSKFNTYLD